MSDTPAVSLSPRRPVYYGRYRTSTAARCPASRERRARLPMTMLFIVVHQAYELWFKQIPHELDRVQGDFAPSR